MAISADVTFEILKHIGILGTHPTGWTKELNIVRWNGGVPKYDIREWDETHERMSRGVTLSMDEGKILAGLLSKEVD